MPAPKRIGILGGSFNPAHEGHLHISLAALKALRLQEVWWLVSPGNPLKSEKGMAPYDVRVDSACAIASDKRIIISHFEQEHNLRYTADTLRALREAHPEHRFTWLMGADNLAGFHRWKEWQAIFEENPVAIFDRVPFSHQALRCKTAKRFEKYRLPQRLAPTLTQYESPAWVYLHLRRHPLSATQLRKSLGKAAFMRHNKDGNSS